MSSPRKKLAAHELKCTNGAKAAACNYCGHTFKDRYAVMIHVASHHPEQLSEAEYVKWMPKVEKRRSKTPCPVCRTPLSASGWRQHKWPCQR